MGEGSILEMTRKKGYPNVVITDHTTKHETMRDHYKVYRDMKRLAASKEVAKLREEQRERTKHS